MYFASLSGGHSCLFFLVRTRESHAGTRGGHEGTRGGHVGMRGGHVGTRGRSHATPNDNNLQRHVSRTRTGKRRRPITGTMPKGSCKRHEADAADDKRLLVP